MADFAACPHCRETITVPADAAPDQLFRCPLCQREFLAADARRPEMAAAPPAAELVVGPVDGAKKKLSVEFVSDAAERIKAPPSSVLRRRERKSNWFGQFVGVVGGGVLGLAIGYCILLRIRGAEGDFLQVADRLPQWATGFPVEPAPVPVPDEPPDEPATFNPPPPPVETPPPVADPPPPIDEPAPQIEAPRPELPPNYVGPRQFTWRTSDDLGEALSKANDALGCENCHSTGFVTEAVVTGSREVDGRTIETKSNKRMPCPVCHGMPTGKPTAEIHAALSNLAEVITFVKVDGDDAMLVERRSAAEKLIRRVMGDQELSQKLGRLGAAAWLSTDTVNHGILLTGTVKTTEPLGALYRTQLVLLGSPQNVTIMSWRKPTVKPGDRVTMLGAIVDDPAQQLIGYQGEDKRVAWGGLAVTNEPPRE
jgi:hypothetical protein